VIARLNALEAGSARDVANIFEFEMLDRGTYV